jgi:hypothetical protein
MGRDRGVGRSVPCLSQVGNLEIAPTGPGTLAWPCRPLYHDGLGHDHGAPLPSPWTDLGSTKFLLWSAKLYLYRCATLVWKWTQALLPTWFPHKAEAIIKKRFHPGGHGLAMAWLLEAPHLETPRSWKGTRSPPWQWSAQAPVSLPPLGLL